MNDALCTHMADPQETRALRATSTMPRSCGLLRSMVRAPRFIALAQLGARLATQGAMAKAGLGVAVLVALGVAVAMAIAARAAGFSACKLFPAQQAGGIGMLKALHAVFPDQLFCPTGGISRQTAGDYLALPNVACVGGSWLVPAEALAAGDWAAIRALAADAATLAVKP